MSFFNFIVKSVHEKVWKRVIVAEKKGYGSITRLSIGKDFTLHCTLWLGQDVWQPSPIHQSVPYPYNVHN